MKGGHFLPKMRSHGALSGELLESREVTVRLPMEEEGDEMVMS